MKKKFGYMLMGGNFDPEIHKAVFDFGDDATYIFTVRNFEEAKARAKQCVEEGFGVLEVCGAFGPEKAQELIDATGNKLGIGYVVNAPAQADLFSAFFGG